MFKVLVLGSVAAISMMMATPSWAEEADTRPIQVCLDKGDEKHIQFGAVANDEIKSMVTYDCDLSNVPNIVGSTSKQIMVCYFAENDPGNDNYFKFLGMMDRVMRGPSAPVFFFAMCSMTE